MLKPIYNITPFTLLDYPDKTACILWFVGCNMRCSYCYNPEIVFGKGQRTYEEALKFLASRVSLLDAVVLSGGECTLHKGLPDLIKKIKALGFKIKIDTNGSNPDLIKSLLLDGLVDFVSLDFKAPQHKFKQITASHLFKKFNETLQFLIRFDFPFEVRTTLHSELITQSDVQEMFDYLCNMHYKGKYFLQNFIDAPETIGKPGASKKNYLSLANIDTDVMLAFRN